MHEASRFCSSQLNIWDVGGQKSLRSYWRNYFEQTDAMIWVVDSADVWRMDDCRQVSWKELGLCLDEWESRRVIADNAGKLMGKWGIHEHANIVE